MVAIDRQRVRHSFEQHAGEYERYACVQKRVIRRFMEIAEARQLLPHRLLDIGAGTGILLGELARHFPGTELVGLDLAYDMGFTARSRLGGLPEVRIATGDAEKLPFPAATFDTVVSTSTFQWLDSLDSSFDEISRVLKPGGTFSFALFGENTLHELRSSYRTACTTVGRTSEDRTQRFFARNEVEAALEKHGFLSCRVHSEWETEIYSDVPALLRSIRRIGAGNPAPVTSRGLSERRVMLEMMEIYRRRYGRDGYIPATYEVIYAIGQKRDH